MKRNIPEQCQYILDRFQEAGYQAYLVGGCVRDQLLQKVPKDWDICTEALPEQTREIFAGHKVILTGLQHGTVTLLLKGMPIEVTTYRIDGEYEDNRHPKEVFFTHNLQEDLSRRDFTINALAYHPDEGIIDFFQGQEDLDQGIVRCVGEAASRYQEDGLRIMRAIRFAAVLGFSYEEHTRQAIKQYHYLLRNIAAERIQAELNKILCADHVEQGLRDLAELGCFPYFMPQICHTYKFAQLGSSHQYDVFTHIIKSVAFIEPELVLRLTMLLHDIGKPFVWQEGSRDKFPGHEAVSAEMAEQILEALHYDRQTIREVRKLIASHMLTILDEPVNIRQNIALLGVDSLRRLLKVKIADVKAHNDHFADIVENFYRMEQLLEQIVESGQCCSLKQLAVSGRELTALGYRGRAVGAELERLLGLVLEQPERNTADFLLQQAKAGLACV